MPGAYLSSGLTQPFGIAGYEGDIRALGAGMPGSRQPDACAAAQDENCLA